MADTTQPTTFSDLYTDLLNRARDETSYAPTVVQAKRYINIALVDMHLGTGEKFPWAERKGYIRTKAKQTTGTITMSTGSTTVLGAGTTWADNDDFGVINVLAGGKLTFNGTTDVYEVRVDAVIEGALAITTPYIGEDLAAASYVYFEDEYALASDFLRPVDQQSFDDNRSIDLVGRTEFRRRYPRNGVPGTPYIATMLELGPSSIVGDTVRRRKIRFASPPAQVELIPYAYVTNLLAQSTAGVAAVSLSADTDEPIVPLQYRHAIVYGALKNWYRDRKDDAREQSAAQDYASVMSRIISDNEVGGIRAQIRPRMETYRRNAKRPWRGSGRGRYDTGGRFDRLEN